MSGLSKFGVKEEILFFSNNIEILFISIKDLDWFSEDNYDECDEILGSGYYKGELLDYKNILEKIEIDFNSEHINSSDENITIFDNLDDAKIKYQELLNLSEYQNGTHSNQRVNWSETNDVGIITHYKNKPFTGIAFSVYDNGELEEECNLFNGLKEGLTKAYYPNGNLKMELSYVNDKLFGTCKTYHKNGQLDKIVPYEDDKRNGVMEIYSVNGDLEKKLLYQDNELVQILKQ